LAYRVQIQGQRFIYNSLYFFSLRAPVHTAGDRQDLCTLRNNT